MQLLETLAHWVADDRRLLEIRSANARRRTPGGAGCREDCLGGAPSGVRAPANRRRLSLIRLLKKNRVRWQG